MADEDRKCCKPDCRRKVRRAVTNHHVAFLPTVGVAKKAARPAAVAAPAIITRRQRCERRQRARTWRHRLRLAVPPWTGASALPLSELRVLRGAPGDVPLLQKSQAGPMITPSSRLGGIVRPRAGSPSIFRDQPALL